VLILLCTLDLAMPVAPTPRGIEFEEDEEVLNLGGFRLSRPAEAADRRDVAATPHPSADRAGAARPVLRAVVTAQATHAPRIRLVADPPPAPPASGEDH